MNSYGNFNLAGIADFSVVADTLAFERLPRYFMICHSSPYKFLRIRATSNFEELNPITGTSQCYGIVSSSYLFKFILSTMRQKILIANIIQYPIAHRQDNI
ncbi:MAG: hypothetical protein EZS28_048579 [Streblomastix strix]|uniref:Uncharacterized protein n=1 Tax=Streblomastix strix TaxID=222440 RepID=A0A5J4TBW4_9EUKA|nr:MAG: hypothetical protein EZS28_048579 [Streblomastix strix]